MDTFEYGEEEVFWEALTLGFRVRGEREEFPDAFGEGGGFDGFTVGFGSCD